MSKILVPNIRPIEELYETPVPSAAVLRTLRKGWQKHPLQVNPQGVHDLVDVRFVDSGSQGIRIPGANQYYQEDAAPYHMRIPGSIPHLLLRREVVRRLLIANEYLRKHDMELFIFDAWRPQKVQYYCRNVWTLNHYRTKHPHWSLAQIENEINRYWADAYASEEDIDQSAPPPHSTGGSVDLGMRAVDGPLLNMGVGFDECVSMAQLDACERDHCGPWMLAAQRCRRVLVGVLKDLGFVPHPNECWHFDYGNQAWAITKSRETEVEIPAFYGAVNPLPYLEE